MKFWELPWLGDAPHTDRGGICRLLDALGTPEFSASLLQVVNQVVPVTLLNTATLEVGNVYRSHWVEVGPKMEREAATARTASFAKHYWQSDPMLRTLKQLWSRPSKFEPMIFLHQMSAAHIRNSDWRDNSYGKHKLVDRFVMAAGHPNTGWILLTLVRHSSQGQFTDAELDWLKGLAPVVLRILMRHENIHFSVNQSMTNLSAAQLRLQQVRSDLTKQETAVCSRILQGKSFEDIGKELGIGVNSVKTYRSRAFRRLGISSRFELLSIFIS